MEHSRTGDAKVAYEHTLISRCRNSSVPSYLTLVREAVDTGPVPPSHRQFSTASRRRTYADGELDVFSADRYFSGVMDANDQKEVTVVVPVESTPRPAVVKEKTTRAKSSAVSASSEVSSNSRTALVRHARGRSGRAKKCYLLRVLCRSCSGKRSVDVNGDAGMETAGSGEPASRIDWFRDMRVEKLGLGLGLGHGVLAGVPPNLNLGAAKVTVGREVTKEEKAEFMSSRRSLTLFSPVKVNLPGDDGGGSKDDDGSWSESSSDLFEIKSLTIDECPYEPSEASIHWSVVTASAADVSVASDRGHRALRSGIDGMAGPMRPRQDGLVGLLTGCVSYKAVDVSAAASAAGSLHHRARAEGPVALALPCHIEGVQKARNGMS